MRAPDRYPTDEPFDPTTAGTAPELTVYPPDDEHDLGPELLGPDGQVIVRRRVNPIGFTRPQETP